MMKICSWSALSLCFAVLACNGTPKTAGTTATTTATTAATTGSTTGAAAAPQYKPGVAKLTKVGIKDTKVGDAIVCGVRTANNAPVKAGDLISIQYTGKLTDGTVFDSNIPGPKNNNHAFPLVFTVGMGQVVPGMDQGVLGMKIGGERDIAVPAKLAYKDSGQPVPFDPNNDLYFHVKVLDIVRRDEVGTYDKNDVTIGTGREAQKGDTVGITYTGKLVDGSVFDSNEGKDPFEFTIGHIPPQVISGLEDAVKGMKVGGVRMLRIPPGIGYETKSVAGIPPNSTLIFKVKVDYIR